MHLSILRVALCLKKIRPHLIPVSGHESNGCPHPRTTDGKLGSTHSLSRMGTLTHTKASNATIAKALATSRRIARHYVSVAQVLEVDAAILVASRVI